MAEPVPHGTTTEAPAQGGGLPQLQFEYWPGQIVWLLIVFAVLYFLLSKVFLPNVRGTLETRRGKIAGDMEEARRLRDQAEAESRAAEAEMAEARARAQRTAAEAKAKSNAEAAQRQAALEAELGERLSVAEARIRTSRDQAMSQVRVIAADTAAAIAEKLTGKAPSPGEVVSALDAVAARGS